MNACAWIFLSSAGSRAALQVGHIGEVGVLLARQELLQMDLELTYVANLRNNTLLISKHYKAAACHIHYHHYQAKICKHEIAEILN